MEISSTKILVIDCELKIQTLLVTRLNNLGYKVFLAANGKDALLNFTRNQPDIVVLDLLLPKLDGYKLCRKIRETSQVPIIILTALNDISDKVKGFNLGADDYLIKPFSPKELEARIKSVLKRSNPQTHEHTIDDPKIFQVENLTIDLEKKSVLKNNLKLTLTNLECSLLKLLIENAGRSFSRTMLLDNVWGYIPVRQIDTRIVDVQISRLRAKIEKDPSQPDFIITVRGIGYKFQYHNGS